MEAYLVNVPLDRPFRAGRHGILVDRPGVVVEVQNAEGLTGWGQCDDIPTLNAQTIEETLRVIKRVLAPTILGHEAANFGDLHRHMDAAVPGEFQAKSALDMAVYDLVGKASSLPVWALLGGKYVETATFAALLNDGTPEEQAEEARTLVAQGWATVRVKLGSGIKLDEARVRALRAAVGPDIAIRVDATRSYNRVAALDLIQRLGPFGVACFDEPIDFTDIEGWAWLQSQASVPLMADKAVQTAEDLVRIAQAGAARRVKLSVKVHGGIYRAHRLAAVGEAVGMEITFGHATSMTLTTLAEMHVCAANPNGIFPIEAIGRMHVQEDVVTHPLDIGTGSAPIPDLPGLGAEVDRAKLREYAFTVRATSG